MFGMLFQAHEADVDMVKHDLCKQVAWAHSTHGSVVACGSGNGLVTIWQQAPTLCGHDEEWIQRATLTESSKPINHLQFAPAQLGPQLAVASDDGYIRFYEASAALDADHWRLCNDLQVCFRLPQTTWYLSLVAVSQHMHAGHVTWGLQMLELAATHSWTASNAGHWHDGSCHRLVLQASLNRADAAAVVHFGKGMRRAPSPCSSEHSNSCVIGCMAMMFYTCLGQTAQLELTTHVVPTQVSCHIMPWGPDPPAISER